MWLVNNYVTMMMVATFSMSTTCVISTFLKIPELECISCNMYDQNEGVPSKRNTCNIIWSFNCTSSLLGWSIGQSLGPGNLSLTVGTFDEANSRLSFELPIMQKGLISVEIAGKAIDSTCRRVMLTADCDSGPDGKNTLLNKPLCIMKACIQLPNGSYNVSALQEAGGGEEGRGGGRRSGIPLLATSFGMPYLERYEWEKVESRSKHAIGENSLGYKPDVDCRNCLNHSHSYDPNLALLTFNYSCRDVSEYCCQHCTKIDLALWQYPKTKNQSECERKSLQNHEDFKKVKTLSEKDINKTGSHFYPNTDTGCYTIRMRPKEDQFPIYHGFFWLENNTTITNMNNWNTTFHISTNEAEGIVDVRWEAPQFPYNFSHYRIQLWYSKINISCIGETKTDVEVEVFPKEDNEAIIDTYKRYNNMSSGWYCARVTPIDSRCGPSGCDPLASHSRYLPESSNGTTPKVTDEYSANWLIPVVAIFSSTLLVVLIIGFIVHRRKMAQQHFGLTYKKVTSGNKLNETPICVVVWTRAAPDGSILTPVVEAFKAILANYSRCKVLDYLDLLSLPPQQRQQLLANPTAWVDYILLQQNIKIILIASGGAHLRQMSSSTPENVSEALNSLQDKHLDPMDNMLFTYFLRKLRDRPDIADDYSRVFHVRFPTVCSEENELQGVVTWTRYRIPEHLKSLTLKLHGISNNSGEHFPEPTNDVLSGLHTALASCQEKSLDAEQSNTSSNLILKNSEESSNYNYVSNTNQHNVPTVLGRQNGIKKINLDHFPQVTFSNEKIDLLKTDNSDISNNTQNKSTNYNNINRKDIPNNFNKLSEAQDKLHRDNRLNGHCNSISETNRLYKNNNSLEENKGKQIT